MKELLLSHYAAHPAMELQDGAKFLYQSVMGGGHLIADEQAALARLEEEWAAVPGDPEAPLGEQLGSGLFRLHLEGCKGRGFSPRAVNRLFCASALAVKPDRPQLEEALELLRVLPFPVGEVQAYLDHYKAQDCPMVGHSPAYRTHYSPAYRVVRETYLPLLPLLTALEEALGNGPVRLAIDGPCATGKSTLGTALAELYGCPLVHMDDFFLQPHQRTPERLAQPGENVDHERFSAELLSPLLGGKTARYRPWRCHDGSFGPEVTVEPGPLLVVEGCYSLRPDLREAYTLRVWVEAPWEVRRQRLLDRCGTDGLARFEALWIPLENRYFAACQVKDCCHLTLNT